MNAAILEIDLQQAAAGMTLAAALLDANGSVLLPPGAALTEATLASLRRRGIRQCVVWVPATGDAATVDPALRARRTEQQRLRLAHLFRHSGPETGAGMALMELLLDYRRNAP